MSRARFFPLAQAKRREVSLRSELGSVKLAVRYGQDRQTQQWLCPLLRQWGMGPHQKITPAWAEKLSFTVTATGSYEEAAQVASKWGEAVDDSTLHALVQRGWGGEPKIKPSNDWSNRRRKGNQSVRPAVWPC
jgi:hypothetical protein